MRRIVTTNTLYKHVAVQICACSRDLSICILSITMSLFPSQTQYGLPKDAFRIAIFLPSEIKP